MEFFKPLSIGYIQGKIDQLPDMETFYRRFEVEDGTYSQIVQEVIEEERPPMIEIEGYREHQHLLPIRNIFAAQ